MSSSSAASSAPPVSAASVLSSFLSHPLAGAVDRQFRAYEKDFRLSESPLLGKIHDKTGWPHIYCFLAVAFAGFLVIVQLLGLSFISNCVAFVPIYKSFKAIRSPGKDDDERWLTYWVVYGCFTLFESALDILFFWMPLYYLIKMCFLIWCYHPNSNGSLMIYRYFVAPAFVGIQKEVENVQQQQNNGGGGGGASEGRKFQ